MNFVAFKLSESVPSLSKALIYLEVTNQACLFSCVCIKLTDTLDDFLLQLANVIVIDLKHDLSFRMCCLFSIGETMNCGSE